MRNFNPANYDQSFSAMSLARCILPSDFYFHTELKNDVYRSAIVNMAVDHARDSLGFAPNIISREMSGKPVFSVTDLSHKLVLRKCAKNIRIGVNVSWSSRAKIIREVKPYLKGGGKYRIYRFDIESFFENCQTNTLLEKLSECHVSIQTQNILKSFLSEFNHGLGPGIPRGVEVSPVLSELCLMELDSGMREKTEVFYYTRFVDDMLIVTSSDEDKSGFVDGVRKLLPAGLNLNYNKTKIQDVPKRSVGSSSSDKVVASVDYLGYSISVVDTDLSVINPCKPSTQRPLEYRKIHVDLSARKQNRTKEKISKAFFAYGKNTDYRLLHDRLLFLTTNRFMVNKGPKQRSRPIPTGVYYSYSEVDFPSVVLRSLDEFMVGIICKSSGRCGSLLIGKLTPTQKEQLLKLSFSKGSEKRIFKRFSPNRLREISRIW